MVRRTTESLASAGMRTESFEPEGRRHRLGCEFLLGLTLRPGCCILSADKSHYGTARDLRALTEKNALTRG
jgi:hypothetical protein